MENDKKEQEEISQLAKDIAGKKPRKEDLQEIYKFATFMSKINQQKERDPPKERTPTNGFKKE
jgi:hypothetical protein